MLFITRDIGITAHFCDRVAVIYGGEIVELAPREPFFANPHHPYTVLLLAAFSHNPRLRGYWHRQGTSAGETGPAETGCPFAARCVRARDRCRAEPPRLRELRARPLRPLPFSGGAVSRGAARSPGSRQALPDRGHAEARPGGERGELRRRGRRDLALVGESGSGKTTIGRCVLGLIRADGGHDMCSRASPWAADARSARPRCAAGSSSSSRSRPSCSTRASSLVETIGEPLVALGASRADREKAVRARGPACRPRRAAPGPLPGRAQHGPAAARRDRAGHRLHARADRAR